MKKVLAYVGHAQACQILAKTALRNEFKVEYVKLAACWMNLADERQIFLAEAKRIKPR